MVTEAFPVFMSLVRKENGLIYAEPEFRINRRKAINIAGKDYFDKKKSLLGFDDLVVIVNVKVKGR